MRGSLPLIVMLWILSGVAPAVAQFPLFDAHIHYSRPDWDAYTPERVLSILAAAGVRRAIVSSTRDDMGSWHNDPGVKAYVEERLKRGIYRGIGEFHLSAADAGAPVVKRVAELAAARGLFLQAHVDDTAIEKLLTLYPEVRVLWAHAGMSASASTVGRLLERYPKLWVELA